MPVRYAFFVASTAACVVLAACDQDSKSNDVSIKDKNGSVTISANGQNFTMKASDDKKGSFVMSANGGHFTMKASDGKQSVDINATGGSDLKLPEFLAAYPGATVKSTTIGSNAQGSSGTFIFETQDAPQTVIAWYKKKSADEGLARGIDMNTGTTSMFTASTNGGKKALQVVAASSGSGARVQVNWTGK